MSKEGMGVHGSWIGVGDGYQYKTILNHATILKKQKQKIFFCSPYLKKQKPDRGLTHS